jgi:hypothetical protein
VKRPNGNESTMRTVAACPSRSAAQNQFELSRRVWTAHHVRGTKVIQCDSLDSACGLCRGKRITPYDLDRHKSSLHRSLVVCDSSLLNEPAVDYNCSVRDLFPRELQGLRWVKQGRQPQVVAFPRLAFLSEAQNACSIVSGAGAVSAAVAP